MSDNKQQSASELIEGHVRHIVFGPRGDIEGVLIEVGGRPLQLLVDKHDRDAALAISAFKSGQSLAVEATPAAASEKGKPEHPVWRLDKLLKIDGQRLKQAARTEAPKKFAGTVKHLNYAKHGQANGFVLDSGDFIHVKPEGFKAVKSSIGDRIEATGEAKPLAFGTGYVVEARRVNGVDLAKMEKHKPQH